MSKVQTENSFIKTKIKLREEHLPEGNINVLDCFSADGKIWNKIKDNKKDINVLRIEKENNHKGIYLKGDNLKFLASIDLSKFDVIDLDAFGIPFKQLEIVIPKLKRNTVVFITFIQSMFGQLPKKMLDYLGYTDSMIKKCPTLFNKNGFEKFCNYLYYKGLRNISFYNIQNKYYIYTKIGE